jgi:predicted ATPase
LPTRPAAGAAEEIAEQIIERTDSVPLFIEELTRTVVEAAL